MKHLFLHCLILGSAAAVQTQQPTQEPTIEENFYELAMDQATYGFATPSKTNFETSNAAIYANKVPESERTEMDGSQAFAFPTSAPITQENSDAPEVGEESNEMLPPTDPQTTAEITLEHEEDAITFQEYEEEIFTAIEQDEESPGIHFSLQDIILDAASDVPLESPSTAPSIRERTLPPEINFAPIHQTTRPPTTTLPIANLFPTVYPKNDANTLPPEIHFDTNYYSKIASDVPRSISPTYWQPIVLPSESLASKLSPTYHPSSKLTTTEQPEIFTFPTSAPPITTLDAATTEPELFHFPTMVPKEESAMSPTLEEGTTETDELLEDVIASFTAQPTERPVSKHTPTILHTPTNHPSSKLMTEQPDIFTFPTSAPPITTLDATTKEPEIFKFPSMVPKEEPTMNPTPEESPAGANELLEDMKANILTEVPTGDDDEFMTVKELKNVAVMGARTMNPAAKLATSLMPSQSPAAPIAPISTSAAPSAMPSMPTLAFLEQVLLPNESEGRSSQEIVYTPEPTPPVELFDADASEKTTTPVQLTMDVEMEMEHTESITEAPSNKKRSFADMLCEKTYGLFCN